METRRYETLDGLRGVAACCVLAGHLSGPFTAIVPRAYLAVDLFFLMSGFVIAAAYERRLHSGWSVPGFLAARLKRLWPLYLLSFVVAVVCYWTSRTLNPSDDFLFPKLPLGTVLAMGILFLPQLAKYGGGAAFPLNPAAWSLSTEIFGNIVYAFVSRTLTTRVLVIFSAIGAIGIVIVIVRAGSLNVGAGLAELKFAYVRFCFSFSCGVLLHRLHLAGSLPAIRVSPWLVLGAAVLVMSGLLPAFKFLDLLITVLFFPLLIIAAVTHAPSRKAAGVFARAGAMSYPLYVLHQPVTSLILSVLPPGPFHVRLLLYLPPAFVLAAIAAERWFDTPLRRWISAHARWKFRGVES